MNEYGLQLIENVEGENAAQALMRLTDHVTFTARPSPLIADLRLSWRLPLLLITLHVCCLQGQSSHKRLHLLNWAVRTPSGRRQLLAALNGERRPQDVLMRTDPVVSQVIDYARGEGLVTFPRGDRVKLTKKGAELAAAILAHDDCMEDEKRYLRVLGRQVTEAWVTFVMSVGTSS
jgi:hypothetical protein